MLVTHITFYILREMLEKRLHCFLIAEKYTLQNMHFMERQGYQQGSPCQDSAGNRTTRRPPDRRKVT